MLDGYAAVVDWPAASFWEEIAAAHPEAIILHSTRSDADTWFRSGRQTILRPRDADPDDPSERMIRPMFDRVFDGDPSDRDVAIAGYERHNQHVIDTVPPERLLQYQPGDGWAPLCEALGVPIPDEPYPHTNTTAEFRARAGLDDEPGPAT